MVPLKFLRKRSSRFGATCWGITTPQANRADGLCKYCKGLPHPPAHASLWVVIPQHVAPNLELLFLKNFNGTYGISVHFFFDWPIFSNGVWPRLGLLFEGFEAGEYSNNLGISPALFPIRGSTWLGKGLLWWNAYMDWAIPWLWPGVRLGRGRWLWNPHLQTWWTTENLMNFHFLDKSVSAAGMTVLFWFRALKINQKVSLWKYPQHALLSFGGSEYYAISCGLCFCHMRFKSGT